MEPVPESETTDTLILELRKLRPDFGAIESIVMFASDQELSLMREVMKCTEDMSNGMNLLHKASQAGSVITVTTILDAKSSVNVESSLGRTALHYACDNDHVDVVKALLCC